MIHETDCVMGATLQRSKSIIVLVTISYDKSPPTQGMKQHLLPFPMFPMGSKEEAVAVEDDFEAS